MPALWSSAELCTATSGECAGAWDAHGLSIDSRTINSGELFIALQGPTFDGHDFVLAALARGAAGALVHKPIPGADPSKLILVSDSFTALHELGKAARARSHATILAVTGSVGKTGCKEALRHILNASGPTYASVGSFNNHWGVPLSLARMPRDTRYGVFELGMNHAGELGPLSKLVRPHIALVTTVVPVHIGNFENLEAIAHAKAEIFEGLGAKAHAVINADNEYAALLHRKASACGAAIHTFGKQGADAKLVSAELSAEGSRVTAEILGKPIKYEINIPGEHWVMNSLAALLCAGLAGADLDVSARALKTLAPPSGRGEARQVACEGGSFTLIDESYNASPAAVEMAIRVLGRRAPGPGGRRILALADMRELGASARDLHLGLLPHIESAGIDLVFCCGEHMKHLYDALPAGKKGGYAFTSEALTPLVTAALRPGDIITVKGSHSMQMEKLVAALVSVDNDESSKR